MNVIAWLLDLFQNRNRRMDEEWRYVPTPNIACRRWGVDYL